MASDVERIAEVLNAHQCVYGECSCGQEFGRVQDTMAQHQAEQLTAAGIGHVPTALQQAADALESTSVARRDKELSAGSPVEDMREDRLIRLGIAEATVTIRTIAKTVEAKP